MERTRRLVWAWWLVPLLLLATAPVARGDHLPVVALSAGSPIAGALAPLQVPPGVRLDAVDARLDLEVDGYRVTWKAILVNGGAGARLRLGIPLRRLQHIVGCGEGERAPDCDFAEFHEALAGVAESLHLSLAGAPLTCRLMVPPGPRWRGEPPKNLLPWKPSGGEGEPEGWCVTEAAIPAHAKLPLEASWEVGFTFADQWNYQDGTTSRGARTLSLDLLPDGWNTEGHRGSLQVNVIAGRFAAYVHERPPALRWSGERGTRALGCDGMCAGLAKASRLELSMDVEPLLRSEQLVGCNDVRGDWEVRASSTLAPQGAWSYWPKNVLDRDPATAWCEGAAGPGVGSWIELVYHPSIFGPGDRTLGFAGYVLVPGYAHSQAVWDANRRLSAFRIAPCDRPDGGVVVRLGEEKQPRLPSRAEASAMLIQPLPDDPIGALLEVDRDEEGPVPEPRPRRGEACVRLTILEVTDGRFPEACISEFRPVLYCSPRPPFQD